MIIQNLLSILGLRGSYGKKKRLESSANKQRSRVSAQLLKSLI